MITGISCPHCKAFYWLNSNEPCPNCSKPRYEDKRSTLYPEFFIGVFGAHTTKCFTGESVRVRNSREQDRLCERHGRAPYRDFKNTWEKSEARQKNSRAEAKKYLKESGFSNAIK